MLKKVVRRKRMDYTHAHAGHTLGTRRARQVIAMGTLLTRYSHVENAGQIGYINGDSCQGIGDLMR